MPFEEIAPIVGRSPTAARQLASRARRRVRGAATDSDADLSGQRKVVDAFLAAARSGDFDGLLAMLDPDVVYRVDSVAAAMSGESEVRGAQDVAKQFAGRAKGARVALINGAVGLVWAPGGQPRAVFSMTITARKIVAIELVADPERIGQLDLKILGK